MVFLMMRLQLMWKKLACSRIPRQATPIMVYNRHLYKQHKLDFEESNLHSSVEKKVHIPPPDHVRYTYPRLLGKILTSNTKNPCMIERSKLVLWLIFYLTPDHFTCFIILNMHGNITPLLSFLWIVQLQNLYKGTNCLST